MILLKVVAVGLFVASGASALVMGIAVQHRERYVLPGRRRLLIGVNDIPFPLDESRYETEAVRHHERARTAFVAMICLFFAGTLVVLLTAFLSEFMAI